MKLSRIDAIKIIDRATDEGNPGWEYATNEWRDKDTDTSFPTIYDVLAALGVAKAEYEEAIGPCRSDWPAD